MSNIDELSREKIRTDFDTNFFVEAGAGSGKTTLLVDRMVGMVASGINIEHICAITFTKAAANEFYDRFYKKLKEKIETEKDETIKKRYKTGLKNIDLAFMGTIDSFCNMIINEHPSINQVPSGTRVIDNEELDTIYSHYYDDLMQRNSIQAKGFQDVAGYKSRSVFINGLKLFNSHRNYRFIYSEHNDFNIDEHDREFKRNIQVIVKFIIDNENLACADSNVGENGLKALIRNANTLLSEEWMDKLPEVLRALKEFKDLRIYKAALHYENHDVVNILKNSSYFKAPYSGTIAPSMKNDDKNNSVFEDKIKEINDYFTSTISSFILDSMNEINERMRKQGLLTFFDFLYYLEETLQNDAKGDGKLIKHINERHKYFMIDEFQDTDPLQSKVFFYLASEEIVPDFKECKPRPGSLFIVGDPKQSIYRFKNADVRSYAKIKGLFNDKEGCEVLNLTKNFRSNKELCSYFNNRFSQMLVAENDDEQSKFTPIPIEDKKKDENFSGVYYYALPKDPDKKDAKKKDIANKVVSNPEYICKIIYGLVNSDKKISYFDKKENKIMSRNIRYSDFMLVTGGKTNIADYTKEMLAWQIPFYVEGKIKFNESEILKNTINLYLSVASTNNIYEYQVAKSSLYGLSDEQFMKNECKEEIDRLKENISYLSPSAFFEKLIETTDVVKCSDSYNLEYLYFVLELLRNKENKNEISTHQQAADYLLKLLSNNNLERCPSLQEEINMVHIANLHKVKGLQKPIVILAHSRTPNKTADVRCDIDKEECHILKIDDIVVSENEDQMKEEKKSLEKEHLRLQYVAATRAEKVLIIGQKENKGGDFIKNYWTDLIDDNVRGRNIKNEIKDFDNLEHSKNKNDSKEVEDNSVQEINKDIKFNLHHPSEDFSEFSKKSSHKNAKLTGSLVHRLMELLTLSKEDTDKDRLIEFILNEENIFEDKTYYQEILSKVFDRITNGGYKQENGAEDNILKTLKNADDVYCEYPFSYLNNGELWVGTIDVLYRIDNQWFIIDYKTDSDGSNLDKRHKAQLEAYKKALNEYLKPENEIIAHAYHIEIEEQE